MADVVTLEFENIDLDAVHCVERWCPVHPSPEVLRIAQHRFLEKSFLKQHGFPVTPFCEVDEASDWNSIGSQLGWPLISQDLDFGIRRERASQGRQCRGSKTAIRQLGVGRRSQKEDRLSLRSLSVGGS